MHPTLNRVLTTIIVLAIMGMACNMPGIGVNMQTNPSPDEEITPQPAPSTPAVITPLPLPNQTTDAAPLSTEPIMPSVSEPTIWNKQRIELFKIELDLPEGWTIQEINRRPEPTAQDVPAVGHDCADYFIVDTSQLIKLSLSPACGFMSGGSEIWPEDAVIIKEKAENSFIIRYFDQTRAMYWYSEGGIGSQEDEEGTKELKLRPDPPIINLGNDQNFLFLVVQFQYMGSKPEEQQIALSISDKIVSSMQTYP